MPSNSAIRFLKNLEDVKRLLNIHGQLGTEGRGRRYGLEVLNKSAIVLLTAMWEAYCEDLAEEALLHIVNEVPDASKLPLTLRKQTAQEIKKDPNELAMWDLADKGWKDRARKRLTALNAERNRNFNTPKSHFVDDLFERAIGLENLSSAWHWRKTDSKSARQRLDNFIELRGSIAHRGQASSSVKKSHVYRYFKLILRIALRIEMRVSSFCYEITGKLLWTNPSASTN